MPIGELLARALRQRFRVQAFADAVTWAGALGVGWLLRIDFDLGQVGWRRMAVAAVIAAVLQLLVGSVRGLYSGRHAFGSLDEVAGLTWTIGAVTSVGFMTNFVVHGIPRSLPIIAGLLAFVAMGGYRYAWRLVLEHHQRPAAEGSTRVLVFGAGEGGRQLLTSMLRDSASPYWPVGLLDDDPATRNLRVRGVRSMGTRDDIATAAEQTGAEVLAIAIPSADAGLVRELSGIAETAGLRVMVLPPVGEILDGKVGVGQLRTLSELDLLGRHQIDTDVASIAGYLTGRRVLVTGAGGSIGSELCRQIHEFHPSELILLDRDESSIHAVQLSIHGRALLDGDDLVIADIRDVERMHEVFERHRPEVVFHAAALKHLPLLEKHPTEGIKTNVYGTLHVLEAALSCGVDRFVNISTDKAADPTSVLGYTKRIAERLTAWAAEETDYGTYLSVRFGNVLGSRGSVLTAFRKQIEDGGPVTVTDPDVTRYFMTVEEAVQLVIQAGAIGRSGEALVLDMGEPVNIAEVAERLIAESGKPIEIEYTGMREGEKLHEVLLGTDEVDERPVHPLVSQVNVPALASNECDRLQGSDEKITDRLAALSGSMLMVRAPLSR